MKKNKSSLLKLATWILVLSFCGGSSETVEDTPPTETATESQETVEETSKNSEKIIISDIKKKPKNNGISDEDFEGYLAGLEDYGPGGSFVPIPLNLDDFIPFTESGNCLSEDVKVIEPREYIYMLEEAYWGTREDMTYGYISENGNVARNGPNATLNYEKLVAINSQYILEEFDEFPIESYTIYWNDYETLLKSLCSINKDNRGYLEMKLSTQELINWDQIRQNWHLSNWERFDYITTGRNIIKPVTPSGLEAYTKYIATSGVIITAVDDVPDEAVLAAYDSITRMLSKRPDFHQILYDGYARAALYWEEGSSHGLPEWEGDEIFGGFAGGYADPAYTANAKFQCYPGNIDRGGDPVIHELVHTINHIVFEAINEVYFYERVFNYAIDAIEKEIFATDYTQQLAEGVEQDMSHFIGEYWAITNEAMAMNKAGFKESHTKIDWVKENDPNMFALAQRYFPTEPWGYCPDVEY